MVGPPSGEQRCAPGDGFVYSRGASKASIAETREDDMKLLEGATTPTDVKNTSREA